MKEFKSMGSAFKIKTKPDSCYQLRFSKPGYPDIEIAYSMHYVLQKSSQKKSIATEGF